MDVHVNSYVTECWLCGGHLDSYNYKVLTGADGPAAHVSVDPGDLLCTMSTQRFLRRSVFSPLYFWSTAVNRSKFQCQ